MTLPFSTAKPLQTVTQASSSAGLLDPRHSISDPDFDRLSSLLHAASGIALAPSKKGLVVSRLAKRLRDLGMADFSTYLARLEADEAEQMAMVSALTTNVTGFFREAHHFDVLASRILPPLITKARAGGRVRLWSSACSTGEEAYSLAMTVLSACPDAADLDIRILATDIDPVARATAEAGHYSGKSCEALGPDRIRRFMQPSGAGHFAVLPAVRNLVTFNALNLVGDWPMSGMFDVIFCRNVVIYFDAETRTRLWRRFAAKIPSGGHLFIGHSERIDAASEEVFESTGVTIYRRR